MELIKIAWTFLGILVAMMIALYFLHQWSRRTKLKSLEKLGFKVTKNIDTGLKKQLLKYAPKHMGHQNLGFGYYSIGDSLLIWWFAKQVINDTDILCWSFRIAKDVNRSGTTSWYTAIYIDGCEKRQISRFISKVRMMENISADFVETDNALLIVHEAQEFKFSNTRHLLEFLIQDIRNN